jgi:hypothetical protein
LWEGDTLEKRRAVRAYLKEHGYRVAQVSLDFEDYAWNDAYSRCSAKGDEAAISWLQAELSGYGGGVHAAGTRGAADCVWA